MNLILIVAVFYSINSCAEAGVGDMLRADLSAVAIGVKSALGVQDEIRSDLYSTMGDFKDVLPPTPVPQMIQGDGYPVESHYVTTSDGYVLNIFRIPRGKTGKKLEKVVYLQHGLLASAADWVIFGPKRGLGYILADLGYDVWLGNCRGNTYSRNHTKYSPKDKEFWKFSWHEIGIYDIPAMIDYILGATGKTSLYHIGHSQGTTSFYVMTSMRPEYNKKIKHHISLAPVVYMNHLISPMMRIIAPATGIVASTLDAIGQDEFLPNHGLLNHVTDRICSESIGQVLCKNVLFALMGFSPNQLDVTEIPKIMVNYPAGASSRQVAHYGQEVISGRFCQFDFGILKNNMLYKSMFPPNYDLGKVSAPLTLIYSSNDWFAAVVDVERLAKKLKSLKQKYLIPIESWNHLDFLFGKDAPSIVYDKVIDILSKN